MRSNDEFLVESSGANIIYRNNSSRVDWIWVQARNPTQCISSVEASITSEWPRSARYICITEAKGIEGYRLRCPIVS